MPTRTSAKEKTEPEYRLLVAPHFAERTLHYVTRMILETTRTFATFRYELSVEEEIDPGSIALSILGFKTPHLTLPAAGPARFQKDYEGLKGTYTVIVQGIDGREDTFLHADHTEKGGTHQVAPQTVRPRHHGCLTLDFSNRISECS